MMISFHSSANILMMVFFWDRYSIGKIEQPCFLPNPLYSLPDVSAGITATELWVTDQERLETVYRAVDWLPCNKMTSHPRSPVMQSRNLRVRRTKPTSGCCAMVVVVVVVLLGCDTR
jgi:hypothetical protein